MQEKVKNFKEMLKKLVKIPLVIFLIGVFAGSFFKVQTGEVAIIKTFGKVTAIRTEGLSFKIPLVQSKNKMVVREQTISFGRENATSILASTKDMQTVEVELTVSYTVNDPMLLYRQFAGIHGNALVFPRVKDAVQSNVARYSIEEFVAKRAELAANIDKELKEELEPYGITLTNVSIVNHDFSDAYEQAVEAKKVAEQAAETEKQVQRKKIIEAEAAVELANLEIEKKKKLAEANKVETQSLTPAILQKMWLEKWNGVLPQVTSDNSSILYNGLNSK